MYDVTCMRTVMKTGPPVIKLVLCINVWATNAHFQWCNVELCDGELRDALFQGSTGANCPTSKIHSDFPHHTCELYKVHQRIQGRRLNSPVF